MENNYIEENNKLIEYISIFLKSKVDYNRFIMPFKYALDLSDPIQITYPNDNFNFLRRDSFSNKEEFITFALGHISSNPSNKENAYLLERLYYYGKDSLASGKPCPNATPEDCEKLYQSLLSSCNSIRNSLEHNDRVNPNIYYIESERGAGKTIFINHFFNKFNDEFAKNSIFWIRMDLDSSVLDNDTNLERYINNKLFKTILKHYSRNSKYNFTYFISEIKELINSNPYFEEPYKIILLHKFNTYINKFHNNNPIQITDQTYDEIFIDTMYHVLRKHKIKVIYIIDNIDLLDKSEIRLKKLNNYLNQIKKTFLSNLRENGVFILTYRSNLHNYLTSAISSSAKVISPKFYRLNTYSFDDIFHQKVEMIKERVSILGKPDRRNWNLLDWPEQIDDFYYFIQEHSEFDSIDDFLIFLESYYHSNNRSKTQIIQLLYQSFVLSRRSKNKYRVIEYLFLSGYRFTPKVFHYSIKNDQIFLEKAEKIYDNIFIPNLFSYPYVSNAEKIILPISQSYLLIKIRLIQLLLGVSNNEEETSNIISIDDVLLYLEGIYKYDKQIILSSLDEFCELEFVELNKKDGGFIASRTKEVRIKPKLKSYFHSLFSDKAGSITGNVLNFNLFNDIAYLNLCSMRLNISEPYYRVNPIIKPISYDLISQSHDKTLDWLQWKIINSFSLVKYIYEIEKFEDQNCILPTNLSSRLESIYINRSNYANALTEKIVEQIAIVLKSIDEKDCITIVNSISNHIESFYGNISDEIKTAYNK